MNQSIHHSEEICNRLRKIYKSDLRKVYAAYRFDIDRCFWRWLSWEDEDEDGKYCASQRSSPHDYITLSAQREME